MTAPVIHGYVGSHGFAWRIKSWLALTDVSTVTVVFTRPDLTQFTHTTGDGSVVIIEGPTGTVDVMIADGDLDQDGSYDAEVIDTTSGSPDHYVKNRTGTTKFKVKPSTVTP